VNGALSRAADSAGARAAMERALEHARARADAAEERCRKAEAEIFAAEARERGAKEAIEKMQGLLNEQLEMNRSMTKQMSKLTSKMKTLQKVPPLQDKDPDRCCLDDHLCVPML